jgi:transcriptional regulator with XRE-family HTH domain
MLPEATMAPPEPMCEPMTPEEFRGWYARLGLNQQHLAERLPVDQSTISRWLNGERKIPPYLWRALEHLAAEIERGRPPRTARRPPRPPLGVGGQQ